MKHHPTVLKLLKQAGADLDTPHPLRSIVEGSSKQHLEAARLLIDSGADPTDPELMRLATVFESGPMLKLLVDAGADVNRPAASRDGVPMVPLYWAVMLDAKKGLKTLLELGADPNLGSPEKSALEYAKEKKKRAYVKLLEQAVGTEAPAATKSSRSIKASWKLIAAKFSEYLNPGCDSQSLDLLATELGCKLPRDFKSLYTAHDGQSAGHLIPSWRDDDSDYEFLTLERVRQDWQMLSDGLKEGDFEGLEANPDEGIQKVWWHRRWVPFATNGGGDYLVCDLAPAKAGKRGQVISYNHESGRHELLAQSIKDWLSELADRIEGDDR